MKKSFFIGFLAVFILVIALSGCGGGGGKHVGGTIPGQQSPAYTVDGVTFYLRYAPSGSFTSDDKIYSEDSMFPDLVTIPNPYWIAETDVTYQLWYRVYTWATSGSGAGQYHFQNAGREGSMGELGAGPTANSQHPVTCVSWRDTIVWCNALTEYYNAQNGTNLACVYTYNGDIIRDSTDDAWKNYAQGDSNSKGYENITAISTANGFRLPTSNEWELAARYQDGSTWTPGNYASGATAPYTDSAATHAVAWYNQSNTNTVGQLNANALHIKDMSGNVNQWCFDKYPEGSARVGRGGSWDCSEAHKELQLGNVGGMLSDDANNYTGFRLVRTP